MKFEALIVKVGWIDCHGWPIGHGKRENGVEDSVGKYCIQLELILAWDMTAKINDCGQK